LGVTRDVLLLVHGVDSQPLRQQLLKYAKSKGVNIDPSLQ